MFKLKHTFNHVFLYSNHLAFCNDFIAQNPGQRGRDFRGMALTRPKQPDTHLPAGGHIQRKSYLGHRQPDEGRENSNPALRNRELIGLVILDGFVYEDGIWQHGSIYDPREGKTYACKLTLTQPDRLSIRGYMGLSLFGRTEIWTRVNHP